MPRSPALLCLPCGQRAEQGQDGPTERGVPSASLPCVAFPCRACHRASSHPPVHSKRGRVPSACSMRCSLHREFGRSFRSAEACWHDAIECRRLNLMRPLLFSRRYRHKGHKRPWQNRHGGGDAESLAVIQRKHANVTTNTSRRSTWGSGDLAALMSLDMPKQEQKGV